MSYEPLHHKYRPQTFADLVGQEAIAQTLTNAIRTERIAPAYLFTGPRGTGKTSSARILAKSLNCKSSPKPTESPCGKCEVCRTIALGSALDVVEIDAASNTGVDNIREIIERAQFAPVQCRYKVYVVDECHMLSVAAFNALLKTLEEPPARVVFVLATTDPQRVLPTIISRCQRFDFRRIPLEAMVSHLSKIAAQESIDITPEAVTLVAQVAQGGLRDAESLLDQLSLLPEQVRVEAVWDLVGAVPERDLMELTEAIFSDNSEAVLDRSRHLMDRGREPLVVLQNLAGFYRDLLIAKTAPNRNDLVAVTPPTWEQLSEFAKQRDISSILHGQQHLKNSEAQIKNSTQPRLWLEVTLLGLLPSALMTGKPENNVNRGSARSQNPVSVSDAGKGSVHPIKHQIGNVSSTVRQPQSSDAPNVATAALSEQASNASPPAPVSREQPESTYPVSQSAASAQRGAPENSAGDSDRVSATVATLRAVNSAPNTEQAQKDSAQAVPSMSVGTKEGSPGYSSAPQSAVDSQSANLEQVWQNVLDHIQTRSTQTLLIQHGQLIEFNGTVARIGMRSEPLLKMVQDGLPQVEAAFEKVFNQKVAVKFQVAAAKSSKTPAAKEPTSPTKFTEPPPERERQLPSDSVSAVPPDSVSAAVARPGASAAPDREQTGRNNPQAVASPLGLTSNSNSVTRSDSDSVSEEQASAYTATGNAMLFDHASLRDASLRDATRTQTLRATQGVSERASAVATLGASATSTREQASNSSAQSQRMSVGKGSAEHSLGASETKELLRSLDTPITQHATVQPQALLDSSSGNPATAVIESSMSPKAAIADLDAEQVGKAMENLKQFFEGEIVDLGDDFSKREPASTHPGQSEQEVDDDTELLEVEQEEEQKDLGSIKPTTSHQWQENEIAALENAQIQKRPEALEYDEDGDIAF